MLAERWFITDATAGSSPMLPLVKDGVALRQPSKKALPNELTARGCFAFARGRAGYPA